MSAASCFPDLQARTGSRVFCFCFVAENGDNYACYGTGHDIERGITIDAKVHLQILRSTGEKPGHEIQFVFAALLLDWPLLLIACKPSCAEDAGGNSLDIR